MDLIQNAKSCSCHLVHPDVESFQMLCKSPGGGDGGGGGVYKQTRARLLCVGHLWFCLPFDQMKV